MKLADTLIDSIRAYRLECEEDPKYLLLTVAQLDQLDKELDNALSHNTVRGTRLQFAGIPINLVQ
jgi:hypothetical protein